MLYAPYVYHGAIFYWSNKMKIEDIPERERWLWEKKGAIASIDRAFKQVEAGETKEVPAKYIEFDEDEGL